MVKAVVLHEIGGPEVLKWEDVDVADPGPGEALVRAAQGQRRPRRAIQCHTKTRKKLFLIFQATFRSLSEIVSLPSFFDKKHWSARCIHRIVSNRTTQRKKHDQHYTPRNTDCHRN